MDSVEKNVDEKEVDAVPNLCDNVFFFSEQTGQLVLSWYQNYEDDNCAENVKDYDIPSKSFAHPNIALSDRVSD